MAKAWYPVIDYLECMECGSCIKKCSHGVYDKSKAPSPVVSNPAAFGWLPFWLLQPVY